MAEPNDHELLAEFIRHESEEAFAMLVARYVNLVYSVAWRSTGNPHHAQEITQTVFIILARKAGTLAAGTVLSGWLYQTARLTAANFVKVEFRRHQREQEAYRQSSGQEPAAAKWEQIAPLLDAAMGRLGETDRNALLLRFFENKSAAEAARTLKLSEPAVHKRVDRALEKLRKIFSRRGVTLTAAMIAGAVTANSVQAAPAGTAARVAVTASKRAAVAGATLALVKGTLKLMTWSQYRTLVVTATVATLTGGALVTAVLSEPARALPAKETSADSPAPVARETMTGAAFLCLTTPPGAVALQPDGKIVAGSSLSGFFIDPQSGRLGQFARAVVRLNADGSLDPTFSCHAELTASDAARAHIDCQPDGKLLVSGLFDTVDGQPRPGYARLLSDGRVDDSFVPTTGLTNGLALGRTYLCGGTYPAAAMSDGSVVVMAGNTGGSYGAYRLEATGRLIPSATNVQASGFALHGDLMYTLQNDGFWGNKTPDWSRTTPAGRRPMVRPNGQLPFEDCAEPPSATDAAAVFKALFAEVPFELCRVAVRLPEGGAVVGVRDRFVNGIMTAPGRFLRLDKNWMPDFSFTNQYEGDRRGSMTLKRLKDGKFLVAGGFTKMDGEDFSGIARLNADGQIDHGFHCEITGAPPWRSVMDLAVQEDGRIVICGAFTAVNGVPRLYIARLNEDGSLDDGFKNPFIGLDEFQALRFPVHHLAAETAISATNALAPGPLAGVAPPETILITAMKYQGGVARIGFTGKARETYVLQARDALNAANWNTISTNQADASGRGSFSDQDAINHPSRFYRIATP